MTDHAESKKNAKNLVAELFIQRIEINDFNKEKRKTTYTKLRTE